MTSRAIITLTEHLISSDELFNILMVHAVVYLVLPLVVLIVNLLVVCEVRRASHNASTNLGLQQSQQTTSSNSAVPTLMLITTSLVYVFLSGTWTIIHIYSCWFQPPANSDFNTAYWSTMILRRAIFAYNFFVYLITGRQFRSELRSLCCCCCTSVAAAGNNDAPVPRSGQLMTTSVWILLMMIIEVLTYEIKQNRESEPKTSIPPVTT